MLLLSCLIIAVTLTPAACTTENENTTTPESTTDGISSKPTVLPGNNAIIRSGMMIKFTLDDLIKNTETAVIGKVVEILPSKEDHRNENNIIYTKIVFQTERYLYGEPRAEKIIIRVDGGRIGDRTMIAEDEAEFTLGEECVVFLSPSLL